MSIRWCGVCEARLIERKHWTHGDNEYGEGWNATLDHRYIFKLDISQILYEMIKDQVQLDLHKGPVTHDEIAEKITYLLIDGIAKDSEIFGMYLNSLHILTTYSNTEDTSDDDDE